MAPLLMMVLFWVLCFAAAGPLESWRDRWSGTQPAGAGAMAILMGDSQRLLADQLFHKADVYFHSGYYPSIFDAQPRERESHLERESTHADHAAEEKGSDFLGRPRDWIDAFGRHFYPVNHQHLDESGKVQEILPWLEFSADLDPHREETYVVAAYWLRTHLGKVNEAEQFLRKGWRANPDSYVILLELGKLYKEGRHDPERARNVWELALQKWRRLATPDTDPFPYLQLLAHLAQLEEESGRYAEAIGYLKELEKVSPSPRSVHQQIEGLESKKASGTHGTNPAAGSGKRNDGDQKPRQ